MSAVSAQPEPALVALGLGSNCAPERHLLRALAALAHDFAPLRLAAPVLGPDSLHGGADYVNWVCSFVTDWPEAGLRRRLKALEQACSRHKGAAVTLDVDLLYFAGADGVRCHHQCLEPYWLAGLAQLLPEERPEPKGANFTERWRAMQALGKVDLRPWRAWACNDLSPLA
ncbi:MAG: 2-amino-4-hydroxy-6-hydroxymethyldihydropteridine diphosphokinase [Acidithiobacillus sp.]